VELKNDVSMTGTLVSVDQYLNIKIANAQVVNSEKHPQLVSNHDLTTIYHHLLPCIIYIMHACVFTAKNSVCLLLYCITFYSFTSVYVFLFTLHCTALHCCNAMLCMTGADKELLHPRLCGALRADPGCRGGHGAAARRRQKRKLQIIPINPIESNHES
jgi:hypothetical protein